MKSCSGNVAALAGDRLSVYAEVSGGSFNIKVRLNGVNTTLVATGAAQNATLWVTVHSKFV